VLLETAKEKPIQSKELRPKNCFIFPALMVLLSGVIILLAVISIFTRRGGFRFR
jgi:hypothetical protein